MTLQEQIESLYLKSLDEPLTDVERSFLDKALLENASAANDLVRYQRIRNTLLRKEPASFGHFFAQKVANKIMNMRTEIDQQIVFFFKKYQLALVGVFVALLVINIVFADQLDLPSVLGIEDTTTTSTDDVLSFNLYDTLNN